MKFSLRELMLVVTVICLGCIVVGNLLENWAYLGILTGNYARTETICYWIGLQGVLAGTCLSVATVLVFNAVRKTTARDLHLSQ